MPIRLHARKRVTRKRSISVKRRRIIRGGGLNIFTVKYGAIRINSRQVDKIATFEQPQINFKETGVTGKLYTILMWDPDAPAHPSWIHWIVINLRKPEDISDSSRILLEYVPPNPPPSQTHRYFFGLFEQLSGEIQPVAPLNRGYFDVDEFIRVNNLVLISERVMQVSA